MLASPLLLEHEISIIILVVPLSLLHHPVPASDKIKNTLTEINSAHFEG
jgi:hypothetical protein